MDDNTIICRCEDVTWGEIRKQLDKGYMTLDEIKRITRAGMGPCQGKTCQRVLLHAIARYLNKRVEEIQISTYRPPTKPVPLGVLAGGQDD
ncbi:MAG: (2Fe-2S)-binding protein [Atribacterota bacterium]|jgi:bacterioferritin-associated ferredoxin|nr:(2Fe-2S)-binding protein [Atribacterota bacterium]MDY0382445.1 (2Fe-2S)-binding protein [Atribacterota bacterium]